MYMFTQHTCVNFVDMMVYNPNFIIDTYYYP